MAIQMRDGERYQQRRYDGLTMPGENLFDATDDGSLDEREGGDGQPNKKKK